MLLLLHRSVYDDDVWGIDISACVRRSIIRSYGSPSVCQAMTGRQGRASRRIIDPKETVSLGRGAGRRRTRVSGGLCAPREFCIRRWNAVHHPASGFLNDISILEAGARDKAARGRKETRGKPVDVRISKTTHAITGFKI